MTDTSMKPRSAPAFNEPCRACGARLTTTLVQTGTWRVGRCGTCGAGTLTPTPTEEMLESAYHEGVYAKERTAGVVPVLDPVLDRLNEKRIEYAGGDEVASGARLLDVGSGKGRLLRAADRLGFEVVGCEPHDERSDFSVTEYGVRVFQGPLESFPADEAPFDVVTMWHVLEHVPDPTAFLKSVRVLVADSGVLALEVPNHRTLASEWCGEYWQGWQVPYHLTHFTPTAVEQVLNAAGFRVIEMSTWSPELNPFMWVMSLIDTVGGSDQILHRLLKRNWTPSSVADWLMVGRVVLGTAAVGILLPLVWALARAEAAVGRGSVVRVRAVKS